MLKRLVSVYALFLALPALAAVYTDVPLSFGEIAITANDVVSTTTITRYGNQTSTNRIWVIVPGTAGQYTISGLAPFINVGLSVSLPQSSTELYPSTAQFTITAVDIPATVKMDPTGSGQFSLGATLESSGNIAENYYNAPYQVLLDITLTY